MPLTLTATDLATTPTGLALTVGGSAGAPVSVYAGPAGEPFVGLGWQLAGTRTGDGALTASLPPGFWFVFARTPAETTLPVTVGVTDGLDPLPLRCQAAVAAGVRALALPEIAGVYEHGIPDASEMRFPNATVHWVGSAWGEESGLNGLDYVVFPIQIDFYDSGFSGTQHAKRARYLKWLDATGRAFRQQRLAGVPESAYCRMTYRATVDVAAAREANDYQGSLTVAAVVRETRGPGT